MTALRNDFNGPTISVTDTSVLITYTLLTDPDVVAAARSAETHPGGLAHWLEAVTKAGAFVLGASAQRTEIAGLERAVQEVGGAVQAAADNSITRLSLAVERAVDPIDGPLAAAVQAAVTRLATGISTLVTGENAALPQAVRSNVRAITDQALAEIGRSLSATVTQVHAAVANDRDLLRQTLQQTLAAHHAQVGTALTELRTSLAITQTVRKPQSALLGSTYEDAAIALLEGISHAAGDSGATGAVVGATGGKVGDAIVDFAAPGGGTSPGRLVFEAKNRTRLGLDAVRRELYSAKENRKAASALMLCASQEEMPVRGQSIVVLDQFTLVVAWSPETGDDELVRAAYLLLKMSALTSGASRHGGIDATEMQRQLQVAVGHLNDFTKIDRHAGAAGKALDDLQATALGLRIKLTKELTAISVSLKAA